MYLSARAFAATTAARFKAVLLGFLPSLGPYSGLTDLRLVVCCDGFHYPDLDNYVNTNLAIYVHSCIFGANRGGTRSAIWLEVGESPIGGYVSRLRNCRQASQVGGIKMPKPWLAKALRGFLFGGLLGLHPLASANPAAWNDRVSVRGRKVVRCKSARIRLTSRSYKSGGIESLPLLSM